MNSGENEIAGKTHTNSSSDSPLPFIPPPPAIGPWNRNTSKMLSAVTLELYFDRSDSSDEVEA
ncbi:hypothetical protein ANCDUO_16021 [Ancylostoma duodenale]|uniref:Uncharacterized protein n=1 Tax=Ancylostoma duodenale TaxID=51022 RepID=A0A0C2CBY9_9BILA|nr:hypothetical protein ANCDUO_16021 [Ancylostoma duodenale]